MEKAVTIGTFDGVHRGHVLVLDTLKKEAAARGLRPMAVTFSRHPLDLIAPQRAPGSLMSVERKTEFIRREGVDPIVLPFNESLRCMTAYEWMLHLYRKYGVRLLVAGYDNTFGSDGIHLSMADIRAMGETIGMEVLVAPEVPGVSSSRVRKAVKAGDIVGSRAMLGHCPENEGKVVSGFHVGSEIGFPTANLQIARGAVVPPVGVYAAYACVGDGGEALPAMVNIGWRPTFKGTPAESAEKTVEAHIIGIGRDLYGSAVRLEYLCRLRDERKFGSVGDLVRQLERDRAETLRICAGPESAVDSDVAEW